MIIRKLKETLGQVFFSPEATGSWDIECAVDETPVDCQDLQESYVGVPAPAYLEKDPWFSDPVLSEKQLSYKEAHEQAVEENLILDESQQKESADIHQKLYEVATQNWTTVAESQVSPQGGSENFQEGPGGWMSGTGYSQFK